jgi:DNA-binding Lrp family transcriptional regulator
VNLHRRHLTTEQKREVIVKLVERDPERSCRAIAAEVGVSKGTVSAVKQELEGRGQIGHVDTVVDTKGRRQPTSKAKPTAKPKAEPEIVTKVMTEVTEVVTAPPTAPVQPEQPPSSSGPAHAELSLDDIVQIVSNQVAAGKISRSALGSAIWKLQQLKQTISVEKRATRKPRHRQPDQSREKAKAALREDPSLTKRALMECTKCGSKAAVLARRELEAAGEIAPKKAKRADKAQAESA